MDDAARYPMLHRPDRWEWAHATMTFSTAVPPEEVVSNIHVVGFVGPEVLVCRDGHSGVWFLPGGTREPGEGVDHALARELAEEAGAELRGPFHRIGAHVGTTEAPTPFRPHLPHPLRAFLWGWADVEVVGPPSNPTDAEQVAEVAVVAVAEAARLLEREDAWAGELLALAWDRRRAATAPGR